MSVVTCPGPGGPVTFSPANVRDTSCTRRARLALPQPAPGHNQGTIPRAVQGAKGSQ